VGRGGGERDMRAGDGEVGVRGWRCWWRVVSAIAREEGTSGRGIGTA